MVTVYVAGSSRERSRATKMMDWVRGAEGLELAHDWVAQMAAEPAPDSELSRLAARSYAICDLQGVASADVLWLLAPNELTIGAWVEFGFALGLLSERGLDGGPRIVASGPVDQSIFCACAHEEHEEDLQAFESIVLRSRKGLHGKEGDLGEQ